MRINQLENSQENTQDNQPDYATAADYRKVMPVLYQALIQTGAVDKTTPMAQVLKYTKEAGRLPLIRTANINSQQIQQAAAALGLQEQPLATKQLNSSSQFKIHSFLTPNGVTLTIVLAGRGRRAAAAGASETLVLNRKDLTPTKLGLASHYADRDSLLEAAVRAVQTRIKDKNLSDALVSLLKLAHARGAGQLAANELQYIQPVLGQISQDFGEILAPLALAQDGEDITFPVGNEKLIDVTIGGRARYSVKALGGSGTSMNSLGDILDEYELTLTDEGQRKLFQDAIKIWKSTRKEGSITDRIILANNINRTPEYLTYVDILGSEFKTWSQLKALLKPLVQDLSYPDFLKMILPATQAGGWAEPTGLPDDAAYYLGQTTTVPKPSTTGRNSYDANPLNGAANIITYGLGKAMYNLIREGPNREQYQQIMTNMVRQLNCQLGHVDITPQGQLNITSAPFSDLEFKFDYHAPSNIAGNNRPGFLIVPPTTKPTQTR